jgi:hypothetical protein
VTPPLILPDIFVRYLFQRAIGVKGAVKIPVLLAPVPKEFLNKISALAKWPPTILPGQKFVKSFYKPRCLNPDFRGAHNVSVVVSWPL